jgi:ketosteroid isomerase-like protein
MVRSSILGVLGALLLAAPARAQGRSDSLAVTGEIDRLERRWAAALVQQDTAVLQRLLAPEYALIVSASPERPIMRTAWLATLPDYHTRSLTISRLTVRVLGDLAIASFIGDLAARVRGAERSGKYFITDVWRHRDGAWRVVARYSSRPEEASSSTRALEQMAGDSAAKR